MRLTGVEIEIDDRLGRANGRGRDGIIIKESEEGRVLGFEGRLLGLVIVVLSIVPTSPS